VPETDPRLGVIHSRRFIPNLDSGGVRSQRVSELRRSLSIMRSITDVFAQLEAAVQAIGALDWDALPVAELLENLDRLETARRQATAAPS